MKLGFLALIAMLSSAYAADDFGGVGFHSSMEKEHVKALIKDYTYLYKTPVKTADQEFLSTAKLEVGDGANMHNWLLHRVKYIVGESYELGLLNVVMTSFDFPNTPIPQLPSAPTNSDTNTTAKTVMTNLGGALYVVGKQNGKAFGIRTSLLSKIYAKSPRVGILQVGEGLFLKKFLLNDDLLSPANSISRLSTLFHEARHSDGNGKSTSFFHAYCPEGHPYSGVPACEIAGNGPYTIGALSERHLLQNCVDCSEKEKTALTASVADSFARVLDTTTKQRIQNINGKIEMTRTTIETYERYLLPVVTGTRKTEIQDEVKKLRDVIASLELELAEVKAGKSPKEKQPFYDDAPEGEWEAISLKDSVKKIEKSLR